MELPPPASKSENSASSLSSAICSLPRSEKKDLPIYNTVVVSGGASKCIAALGALHYLEEQGCIDFVGNYAGTSAGGIICYLLAIGYTPLEIIQFLISSDFMEHFQSLNLAGLVTQRGLVNFYIINEYLEKLTLSKINFMPTFREIRRRFGKNLSVTVFNLSTKKVEYFNADTQPDMPCLTALRMTANVPLLFERFFYEGSEYIDGGLVDNFPIEYYLSPQNKIIGIDLTIFSGSVNRKQSYINYLLQIALIPYMYFNAKKAKLDGVDIISIDSQVDTFDFSLSITRRLDVFSRGYQAALNFFHPLSLPKEVPKEVVKDIPKEAPEAPKEILKTEPEKKVE